MLAPSSCSCVSAALADCASAACPSRCAAPSWRVLVLVRSWFAPSAASSCRNGYPLLEDPRAVMLDALRIRFAVEFNGQSNYVQRPQRTMCSGHKELCAVATKNYVQWPKNYVQRPQRTMCSGRKELCAAAAKNFFLCSKTHDYVRPFLSMRCVAHDNVCPSRLRQQLTRGDLARRRVIPRVGWWLWMKVQRVDGSWLRLATEARPAR